MPTTNIMALLRFPLTILFASIISQASFSSAFTVLPNSQTATFFPSTTTQLYNVITGSSEEEDVDESLGGVSLAMKNLIKISGKNSEPSSMARYSQITTVEESAMSNVKILCQGSGREFYQDPGSSVEKRVTYSPIEAVKDALSSNPPLGNEKIVVNFLGGDDLKVVEVLQAMNLIEGKNVEFHSLSYSEIPEEVCSVTVVSTSENTGAEDSLGKSLEKGEVYSYSGKFYTVLESDINSDEK